jgi:hypothetical protein
MITVPACEICNGGMSEQEERFRVYLSVKSGPDTPASIEFWQKAGHPSVRANKRLHKELLSGTQLWLRSPSGRFEQSRTFKWPMENHDPVIEKITRGLFYHNFGNILSPDLSVEVTYLNGFDRHLLEIAGSLNRANVGGDERFCYAYSRTSEDPEVSLWFFQFYQRHWAAAITKPSAADADADSHADQWAKRAVDMAKVAHQITDDTSVQRWLDEAESQDVTQLRSENPALWRELRDLTKERIASRLRHTSRSG